MTDNQEHVLIDTYLKKSLFSRMMTWFLRLVMTGVLLTLGLFIAWRMLPGTKQAELREKHAVIEKAAFFLEDKGFAPRTADILAYEQQERDRAAGTLVKPKHKKSSEPVEMALSPGMKRFVAQDDLSDEEIQRLEEKVDRVEVLEAREKKVFTKPKTDHQHRQELLDKQIAMREKRVEDLVAEREAREAATMKYLQEAGLSVSWKPWSRYNPPTWSDFKNQNIDEEISAWGAYISTHFITSYNGNRWEVFSIMIPESSWARPGRRNESTLRHERLHFDITELFARKLRGLIPQTPRSDVHQLIRKIRLELREFQTLYDRQCHGSRENQAKWEADIASKLKESEHLKWVNKPDRLAKGGFPAGSFLLAQIYDHGGDGYRKSPKLAKKWYKLGIQKESTYAMNNMAALYLKGLDGAEPNHKRAFKLYSRAAKRENPYAQFNLGVMYWRGLGTEPNQKKAMEWFVKAADSVPYARKALLILEGAED